MRPEVREKRLKRHLRLERKRAKKIPPTSMKVRAERKNPLFLTPPKDMGNISVYLSKQGLKIEDLTLRQLKWYMHNGKYLFSCTAEEAVQIADILEVGSKIKLS